MRDIEADYLFLRVNGLGSITALLMVSLVYKKGTGK